MLKPAGSGAPDRVPDRTGKFEQTRQLPGQPGQQHGHTPDRTGGTGLPPGLPRDREGRESGGAVPGSPAEGFE